MTGRFYLEMLVTDGYMKCTTIPRVAYEEEYWYNLFPARPCDWDKVAELTDGWFSELFMDLPTREACERVGWDFTWAVPYSLSLSEAVLADDDADSATLPQQQPFFVPRHVIV